MKTLFRCLAVFLIWSAAVLQARPPEENKRIEHLLGTIQNMKDAAFVRSGKEYDGATATAHLRMKLQKAGERVQTAEQFIEGVASKSYLTGKPYQIRFKDGRVLNAADFLAGELKARDAKER